LLAPERGRDPDLDQHVAECTKCAHVALGLARLNSVLTSALVVVPPLELQRQLTQLVLDAPRSDGRPWWRRLGQPGLSLDLSGWFVQRPQMVAAQGLASILLALASWQIFGWLTVFRPVVGDVAYAMELVAASPASVYLGSVHIDLQGLGVWSIVGIAGWLVSEDGLIRRRLSRLRPRLP
jgi:hypothetical protein